MKSIKVAGLLAAALCTQSFSAERAVPRGVPHLDHVFLIMMENHGFAQIVDNPNAPFTNSLAKRANLATSYYAVGHPSLTNYLEVVGGSNFGVRNDNSPDWHNQYCTSNLASGIPALESSAAAVCPFAGYGADAATPAIDTANDGSPASPSIAVDGKAGFDAQSGIVARTIADQLVDSGRSWKSYQESLPPGGANNVDTADGQYSNLTDFAAITPQVAGLGAANIVSLYAVKHDPFAYFKNVQDGTDPRNSLSNIVGFERLYQDLGSGRVPNFAFIAPNQCHDQHGRGNAGPFCAYDPDPAGVAAGSQAATNPALIGAGDVALENIVTAIKRSPAWREGQNAIVILWDENDYSYSPVTNRVALIVDTNYGVHGLTSNRFYTHFSLLKTLDAGFGLPCLNHACDKGTAVMSDLFAAGGGGN